MVWYKGELINDGNSVKHLKVKEVNGFLRHYHLYNLLWTKQKEQR